MTERRSTTDDGLEDSSPFRRPAFLMSAGFLAVVAVLGAVTFIRSPAPRSEQSTAPQASATPANGATQAPANGCRPGDTSQQIPTGPPTGITWQVYKTMALPYSSTAGPLNVSADGEVARCFAHTPVGALIAAVHLSSRYVFSRQWRVIADEQVVPGPGRDAYLKLRGNRGVDAVTPGSLGQIAGFQFVTYDPQTAVVQLVMRFSNGQMSVSAVTVKWQAGDWKLELKPNGSPSNSQQLVSSLAGFTPWGGV
ncbi:hypothetical protein [Actinomadura keratinilytica]|jgi:hypothetical protein|uniref:DUF8175 domain-containing protein n=1 Tax=Actinomadura keratinilytica TaxID=547461 RepID=A0ABP7YTT2_9ACTN